MHPNTGQPSELRTLYRRFETRHRRTMDLFERKKARLERRYERERKMRASERFPVRNREQIEALFSTGSATDLDRIGGGSTQKMLRTVKAAKSPRRGGRALVERFCLLRLLVCCEGRFPSFLPEPVLQIKSQKP
jgi:hypothetical protein